jgi:hypothetical protein
MHLLVVFITRMSHEAHSHDRILHPSSDVESTNLRSLVFKLQNRKAPQTLLVRIRRRDATHPPTMVDESFLTCRHESL